MSLRTFPPAKNRNSHVQARSYAHFVVDPDKTDFLESFNTFSLILMPDVGSNDGIGRV